MVLACLIFVTPSEVQAASHSIYSQGTPSNTYVSYFNYVLNNYSTMTDYVIWRENQYVYHLAVGDIDFSSNVYTSDHVDLYSIDTNINYNTTTSITKSTESNFILSNPNHYILYSSKGNTLNLKERSEVLQYALLTIFILYLVYKLVRFVLSFGAR